MPISQTFETNQAVLPIVHCGSSIFSLNTPKIKSFLFNFLGSIYFLFIIRISMFRCNFDAITINVITCLDRIFVSFLRKVVKNYIKTRLGQLGANISPDRSSLTPQVLMGNF